MTHDPICPLCQQQNSRVLDTRSGLAGSVWRRRLCICGSRFTTYEQVNTAPRFTKLLIALQFNRNVSS